MAKGAKVLTEDDFPDYATLMGILERTERALCKERKENVALCDKVATLSEQYDEVVDDREDLRLEHENIIIRLDKLTKSYAEITAEHDALKVMHAECEKGFFDTSADFDSNVESCLNCDSCINLISSNTVHHVKSAGASSSATNSLDAAKIKKLSEELEELKRLCRIGLCYANIGMQNLAHVESDITLRCNGSKGIGFVPIKNKKARTVWIFVWKWGEGIR
jgi:hypothetical protein